VAQQSWNYGFPDVIGGGFASNGPLVNKEGIYDIRFSINDEKSKNVLAKAFIRVLVSKPSKWNLDGSSGKRQCFPDLASDCNAVNIVQFNMLFFTRNQTNESQGNGDPIRFHSFDVSAYQSGCSQYVTVIL
jgi:hypothetical protein